MRPRHQGRAEAAVVRAGLPVGWAGLATATAERAVLAVPTSDRPEARVRPVGPALPDSVA